MSAEWIVAGDGGVYLDVYVQPGSRRPRLIGVHNGALKFAVAPRAVEGRATLAVVRAVAELLDISPGNLSLVAGPTSRRKKLFASGVSLAEAVRILEAALTGPADG